jgi:hypothetical protein
MLSKAGALQAVAHSKPPHPNLPGLMPTLQQRLDPVEPRRTVRWDLDSSTHALRGRQTVALPYPRSVSTPPAVRSRPNPAVLRSIRVNLRTRQIDSNDYSESANRPILHRKETFLLPDDPRRAKFARLTSQEEKHGLLDDASAIGTREGWQRRLAERGFDLRGHRLVRARSAAEN